MYDVELFLLTSINCYVTTSVHCLMIWLFYVLAKKKQVNYLCLSLCPNLYLMIFQTSNSLGPLIFYSVTDFFAFALFHFYLFILNRALLHFLDPDKFSSKDSFVQNYNNLGSFNETEVEIVWNIPSLMIVLWIWKWLVCLMFVIAY